MLLSSLGVLTAFTSTSALQSSRAAELTNLMGLSSSSHSLTGRAAKSSPRMLHMVPGPPIAFLRAFSSPMAKLAITAIKAKTEWEEDYAWLDRGIEVLRNRKKNLTSRHNPRGKVGFPYGYEEAMAIDTGPNGKFPDYFLAPVSVIKSNKGNDGENFGFGSGRPVAEDADPMIYWDQGLPNEVKDVDKLPSEEKEKYLRRGVLSQSFEELPEGRQRQVMRMPESPEMIGKKYFGEEVKNYAGVIEQLGFFDPLGFSVNADEGKMIFYREAEIKHGRVAMLASLGILVSEQFHPFALKLIPEVRPIDVPAYVAFQEVDIARIFWPLLFIPIAIVETLHLRSFKPAWKKFPKNLWSMKTGGWREMYMLDRKYQSPDFHAGDFDLDLLDPLGLKKKNRNPLKKLKEEFFPKPPFGTKRWEESYAKWRKIQTQELNTGRIAMIAAAVMLLQELFTGLKIFDFWQEATFLQVTDSIPPMPSGEELSNLVPDSMPETPPAEAMPNLLPENSPDASP